MDKHQITLSRNFFILAIGSEADLSKTCVFPSVLPASLLYASSIWLKPLVIPFPWHQHSNQSAFDHRKACNVSFLEDCMQVRLLWLNTRIFHSAGADINTDGYLQTTIKHSHNPASRSVCGGETEVKRRRVLVWPCVWKTVVTAPAPWKGDKDERD